MPEVLYLKWRPRSFGEIAGQEHVATTLINALAMNRVAHAYLFSGPRGTGKTTTGRVLAKALNCSDSQAGEPCNRCESCLSYQAGRAMDLVELDAASNRGIDEIRSLRDKVAFAPGAGAYKVYLIDEVHMLTDAAFNALLKTLEEPPPHVVFILATTDPQKVPATISSRCQRFDFRRIPMAAATKRLQEICDGEGFTCGPPALEAIVRSSTGSLRDAVNLLDQLVTSYGPELTMEHVRAGLGLIDDGRSGELARAALKEDLAAGLSIIASVRDDGLDLRQFQKEVVKELRALMMVKSGLDPEGGLSREQKREMTEDVSAVPMPRILNALRAFGEADLKPDPNSTVPLDIALAECVLGAGKNPAAPGPVERPPTPAPEQRQREAPQQRRSQPPPPSRPAPSATPAAPASRIDSWAAGTPVAGVSSSGVPPSPEVASLRELMPRLYAVARESDQRVAALLNGPCDIIDAGESEVTFGFRYPAHVDKILEPQNVRSLAQAVARVLGRAVGVRCVLDPGVESWRQRQPGARSALVRAAQEMGARVVSPPAAEPFEEDSDA